VTLGRNAAVLGKFYHPGSFLRTCPESVFEEAALSVQPLMVLPFRLHTAFEAQRRASVSRSPFREEDGFIEPNTHIPVLPVRRVPQTVRALYDNHDPDPDELEYSAGDILQVESRVHADWYLCRRHDQQGLVPVKFVELILEPSAS
jgi:hypothetical protein